MRIVAAVSIGVILVFAAASPARAQSQAPTNTTASVPRLIPVSGTYQPATGQAAPTTAVVTLAVYAAATDTTPLWQETQDVALDATGRYTVQLGATVPDGVPLGLFAEGQERWLGVQFAGPGDTERRTRLTSVPYALRAADADTLGGHPASAYVLAPTGAGDGTTTPDAKTASAITNTVDPGTPNFLAKYVNTTDLGPSNVMETGGRLGVGTTVPLDFVHVRFSDGSGSVTGYAVQNLGNTTASYSGMLFYDQNGALGQFQGFNNVTHEYRINNIATNASINFMTGTSRFYVAPNGNIGIGTTSPSALLEVSNALSGVPSNMWVSSYTNFLGPYYLARRARGTAGAPTAVQNGDGLSGLYGMGYGATQFGPASTGGITIQAAQNFTDTQQGTAITFSTTAINATTPATRMTLDATGNLGIGTTCPVCNAPVAGMLEVSNAASGSGSSNIIVGTSFSGPFPAGTLFTGRKARGTVGGPTAVQNGDTLVGFLGSGYGATAFSGTRGGMFVQAAENWTDTAQGTRLSFNTTASGTTGPNTKMTVDPSGNVGIGTQTPSGPLEIVRTGTDAGVVSTIYNNGADAGSFLVTQTARGTAGAPTAVQAGDFLGAFGTAGYAATGFSSLVTFVAGLAAENFTNAAHGTALVLGTNSLGTTNTNPVVTLLPSGNVGIGTPADGNGIPTATDKLQVFGNIRVGQSGTDGCVMNFAGTGLIGTCASDRRYKKGITPFGPTLDRVAALQPVHFYWRADEFPEHHFGDSQAYGLIAQDVERVLPELVVTHEDGYKAVDYSALPLLTVEAIKELKSQNDELRGEAHELKSANEDLQKRVAELERLLKAMRSTRGDR
jgi:hypothetical protein